MTLTEWEEHAIDQNLQSWCQGDVFLDAELEFIHLANSIYPHITASIRVAESQFALHCLSRSNSALAWPAASCSLVFLCDIDWNSQENAEKQRFKIWFSGKLG